MAENSYSPYTDAEIGASPTLSRYALMRKMAREANQPDPPPPPPTQSTSSSHQRGDIVRMPDGSLRLVKQPATPYAADP